MKRLTMPMLALMAAALLQWLIAGQVLAATFDDVTVNEQALPRPSVHAHGYVEYRYVLFNESQDKTHKVRLVIPGNTWGNSGQVSRTVTLLPRAQGLVSLWVPPVEVSGQGMRVFIDGQLQDHGLDVTMVQGASYYHRSSSSTNFSREVLFSQGVDSRFRDELSVIREKLAASSYGSSNDEFGTRTTVPVNQWSESWLGYSAFDGVVMTQNEWRTLPGPVREAICSWVETGGSLLVVGDFAVPKRWAHKNWEWGVSSTKTPKVQKTGLGKVGQIDADMILGWSEEDLKAADARLWLSRFATGPMDISAANNAFPVTDSLGVPARGMLAIMLIFAILIGPVNMIAFARRNQRLWVLVTIPAAAVLFSACVFGYTMIADGVSAVGRARTLTFLDQTSQRAVTLGWLGYYAPLQPSDGLHFDMDTELTPQVGDNSGMRMHGGTESESARMTDWSADQHLATGWISSRIPSHFTLRKNQIRRERLEVSQDEQGNVTVVNGLGSDILTLHLADGKNKVYMSNGPVAAGQKVKLQRVNETAGQGGISEEIWRSDPTAIRVDRPVGTLGANYYLATLREEVFIEQGLANLKEWNTESTVFGQFTMNSEKE